MLTVFPKLTGHPDPQGEVYECFVEALGRLDDHYRVKSVEFSPGSEPLAIIEDVRSGRESTYGIDLVYGKLLPRRLVREASQ